MQGLLLVNLGSPKTPTTKDVKKYLRQFLGDQNVVTLPKWFWRPILNGFVLPMRSWRSATFYQHIWLKEGSPLIVYTQKITDAVQNSLPDWKVKMAMTYETPTIESQLNSLKDEGCDKITVLSLFPEYTLSTTASIIEQAKATNIPVKIIDRFYHYDAYQDAFASHIQRAWDQGNYDKLFISYHGIPAHEVKHGDPYLDECRKHTQMLKERLSIPEDKIQMVFQSKFGPMPWLKPYLKNSLLEAVQKGKRNVLIAAPSFVTECLETIEEDYTQNYQAFRENGGENLDLVPALNDDPKFIEFIVNLVQEKLNSNE
ncbi:ferrochelatase [uncultured Lactobacillus sp.]|uniref:ferrochelatase n=1 Tax=uncultured Lactobacillus sp. TaxID=153152 RepID=UPI002611BC44|nr:ferrochelatase [uncultured Lactobacillus sp.]